MNGSRDNEVLNSEYIQKFKFFIFKNLSQSKVKYSRVRISGPSKKIGPKKFGRVVQTIMTLVKISLAKLLGTFYLISFEFSIEFFRQKFLSALKFEMKIDFFVRSIFSQYIYYY